MNLSKYGYEIPEAGDESSTEWQPGITKNWERLNNHSHNGIDSAKIAFANIQKVSTLVYQADWVATGNGDYSAIVNLPAGYTFNNTTMVFTISTVGHTDEGARIYPGIVKISNTSFNVFVNDNTIDLEVLFV